MISLLCHLLTRLHPLFTQTFLHSHHHLIRHLLFPRRQINTPSAANFARLLMGCVIMFLSPATPASRRIFSGQTFHRKNAGILSMVGRRPRLLQIPLALQKQWCLLLLQRRRDRTHHNNRSRQRSHNRPHLVQDPAPEQVRETSRQHPAEPAGRQRRLQVLHQHHRPLPTHHHLLLHQHRLLHNPLCHLQRLPQPPNQPPPKTPTSKTKFQPRSTR